MSHSRRKKYHRKMLRRGAIVFAAVVLLAAVVLIVLAYKGVFNPKQPLTDGLFKEAQLQQAHYEFLGHDLELEGVGQYSGLYMEDGSMDDVSNVMMIRIKNTGDHDLRLARLYLTYSDTTAEFEITDLPAGKTMVVLEKNRQSYIDSKYLSVQLENVVFFDENMDVYADRYQITGLEGALNVKNISLSDINSELYVYYKYISGDTLFGGITFRVKISDGLKAGELRQVSAGHFDPDNCIILSVTSEAD